MNKNLSVATLWVVILLLLLRTAIQIIYYRNVDFWLAFAIMFPFVIYVLRDKKK